MNVQNEEISGLERECNQFKIENLQKDHIIKILQHQLDLVNESNVTKFLDMNDDCIFHIFKELDIKSLVNLYRTSNTKVNRLMKHLFELELHVKHAVKFNSNIQLNSDSFVNSDWYEVHNILSLIGAHVPNIIMLKMQNFYMRNLTGNFMSQLEELTMLNCSVTRQWDTMDNLQTLRLCGVTFRQWPKRRIGGNADFDL